MAWYKYDSQGRLVTALSTPAINLTTDTINAEYLLANTTLGSSGSFDVDLTAITNGITCDHLRIVCKLRGTVAATTETVYLFWNNDTTTTNYYRQRLFGSAALTTSDIANNPLAGVVAGDTAEANNFSFVEIMCYDYRGSSEEKLTICRFGEYDSTTSARVANVTHQWQNTASINRFQIRTDNHATDLFKTGSEIWVYGTKSLSVVTNATIS